MEYVNGQIIIETKGEEEKENVWILMDSLAALHLKNTSSINFLRKSEHLQSDFPKDQRCFEKGHYDKKIKELEEENQKIINMWTVLKNSIGKK